MLKNDWGKSPKKPIQSPVTYQEGTRLLQLEHRAVSRCQEAKKLQAITRWVNNTTREQLAGIKKPWSFDDRTTRETAHPMNGWQTPRSHEAL